jgi:hypothetical protein
MNCSPVPCLKGGLPPSSAHSSPVAQGASTLRFARGSPGCSTACTELLTGMAPGALRFAMEAVDPWVAGLKTLGLEALITGIGYCTCCASSGGAPRFLCVALDLLVH